MKSFELLILGLVTKKMRQKKEIEASDARHFVILFRDYHLQYRGVYSYTSESDYVEKVTGQGPQKISEDMIEKYYKLVVITGSQQSLKLCVFEMFMQKKNT